MSYTKYEIYKTGIYIDDIDQMYKNLIQINSNPYLKIEFYNMIIDDNMTEHFELIEKNFDFNTSFYQSNNLLSKYKMTSNEFFKEKI